MCRDGELFVPAEADAALRQLIVESCWRIMDHAESDKEIADKRARRDAGGGAHHVCSNIATHWMDHLTAMENSRQSSGLEAFGQRDPLVAYKRRSHQMFEDLTARIRTGIVRTLFHLDIKPRDRLQAAAQPSAVNGNSRAQANGAATRQACGGRSCGQVRSGIRQERRWVRLGRNNPCPCGSGKKYKRCHGS